MKKDLLQKIQFEPLYDRVIVIPEETERVSASGFLKADASTGEDIIQKGEVIAIGPGRVHNTGSEVREPMDVGIGDTVLFGIHSGDDILVGENGEIQRYKGKVLTGTILIKILRVDAILTTIELL